MKTIIRPKSLTELVTETLRDWIVNGEMELGAHLSEARIAKDLEVSRTPVREALNRLEMEGLLHVSPQRGSFVFSLEPEELAKLCDARVALETAALTAAIEEHADALHAALLGCTDRMTDARARRDDTAYLRLDTEFHQLLFDHAGNRFLDEAYQVIAPKMAALRNRLGRHPDHMQKSYREHLEIADAVGRRDLDGALRTLRMHIDRKDGSYWRIAVGEEDPLAVAAGR